MQCPPFLVSSWRLEAGGPIVPAGFTAGPLTLVNDFRAGEAVRYVLHIVRTTRRVVNQSAGDKHVSALQNDGPIFEKIGLFFSVYTVTCKQRVSNATFDGNRAWGHGTASAFHGVPRLPLNLRLHSSLAARHIRSV